MPGYMIGNINLYQIGQKDVCYSDVWLNIVSEICVAVILVPSNVAGSFPVLYLNPTKHYLR